MTAHSPVLGVDFGTSNSAAGIVRDGQPHLIALEAGEVTLPTAFFFDFDSRRTLIGRQANEALIEGFDGRFMRALKRVLGTSLMHEPRQILNERVTFVEVIGRFLAQIKTRAEQATGMVFSHALSGRPVHFHDDHSRDAQAQDDLRACYLAAGFDHVDFLPEPEAAAIASGTTGVGLIVDIGGGTSDFTLFEADANDVTILASHGLRIGGTDFDRAISIEQVMPLLGRGALLRKEMGAGLLPTPNAIFNDLATWEKIPFLYCPKSRRLASEMAALAQEPGRLARLVTVLEDELGHDIAFAVETGKIAANAPGAQAQIGLEFIEPRLQVELSAQALEAALQSYATSISAGALETLRMAGYAPERVERVIYVGGSSLINLITSNMRKTLPGAEPVMSDVFTAVVNGLALASAR